MLAVVVVAVAVQYILFLYALPLASAGVGGFCPILIPFLIAAAASNKARNQ